MNKCCDTCKHHYNNRTYKTTCGNPWDTSIDYCSKFEEKDVSEIDKVTNILNNTYPGGWLRSQAEAILENYISKAKLLEFISGAGELFHMGSFLVSKELLIKFIEDQTKGEQI